MLSPKRNIYTIKFHRLLRGHNRKGGQRLSKNKIIRKLLSGHNRSVTQMKTYQLRNHAPDLSRFRPDYIEAQSIKMSRYMNSYQELKSYKVVDRFWEQEHNLSFKGASLVGRPPYSETWLLGLIKRGVGGRGRGRGRGGEGEEERQRRRGRGRERRWVVGR